MKDTPALTDGEEKPELDLPKINEIIPIESETKDQEPTIDNENVQKDTSSVIEEKDNTTIIQTNGQEALKETISNDISSSIEIKNKNQDVLKSVDNKLENSMKEKPNQNPDSSEEIKIEDIELNNKSKLNDDLEETKENNVNVLDSTKKNENYVIEQLLEIKNDDFVASKSDENEQLVNLNISEEIKILDDAVKKSVQLEDSTAEKYLQTNGELPSENDENTVHNFTGIIENHVTSNSDDIDTKNVELQNSLNTLLSEDLKVNITEKVVNVDTVKVITDFDANDDAKENINGNVVSQDSVSNSSDSETIVNSECLQYEINGDGPENSEQTAMEQPISVITVQTCDAVDSDCSEAYLTPNELNDTPKKILEKLNLKANDLTTIVNDDVLSQLNPSIETNNAEEIPSKHASEAVIELKTNGDCIVKVETNVNNVEANVDKVEANVDDIANETTVKVDEHVYIIEENNVIKEIVDTVEEYNNVVEENVVIKEKNELVENCNETEVEGKEDVNIVLQSHEENDKTIEEGTFCS